MRLRTASGWRGRAQFGVLGVVTLAGTLVASADTRQAAFATESDAAMSKMMAAMTINP